jgi:hypothetical protein
LTLKYHLFADEQLQQDEMEEEARSEEEGMSGAEDISVLVQQIRRETAGEGKGKVRGGGGDIGGGNKIYI